ncbi:hypothetical protein T4A_4646 [Trichinella pseudospiralis]|uniref:Uncharacterized protein n=1 Tax=Trichinella pseudospiralis TaxID=6337 RepID=A0A0V0YJ42_TRIPS|nr:hypothetical protein T4E_748 [Trichinella pseudospiralis]KRY69280.1 hypothetical protein T4A_4646 [Trichinella pseudospiralis]
MSKSGQYSAESPPPYPGTLIPLSLPVVAPETYSISTAKVEASDHR